MVSVPHRLFSSGKLQLPLCSCWNTGFPSAVLTGRPGMVVQDGPHFADWGIMQEEGGKSMASAPIHISNAVVAVLTLASSQEAAFEE